MFSDTLRAAWDWHLPHATAHDCRDLIALVDQTGFNTLVVNRPSKTLIAEAHDHGIRVAAVVTAGADEHFVEDNPDAIQKMRTHEEGAASALANTKREQHMRISHHWFPEYQRGSLLCYDHPESTRYIERSIDSALENADGIALDGFGFRNHYACFCDRCVAEHGGDDAERIAHYSRKGLIDCSRHIRAYLTDNYPDAFSMNHVWPPFNPDPYYGADLYLDYCSQTISWFYRPHWRLERVELEAQLHKQLENPDRNRFVPFIGLYADPYQTRSAARIARELEIALEYGKGSLVFCTLQAPAETPEVRRTIADVFRKWK